MPEVLHAPKTILMAPSGAGKTFSLATLPACGVRTFVIGTEPDFTSSLLDGMRHYKAPLDLLHWTTVSPVPAGWDALEDVLSAVGQGNFESIQNNKAGIGKDKTRLPAMALLNAFKDFKCERDGKSYGDISKFGDGDAVVLDSLSGLNIISQLVTVGYKPAMHQGEWSVAMNLIEQILVKLTTGPFWFICTAHVEKEMNEITGLNTVTVSTLGRKLGPKLGRFFSDMVLAKKVMAKDGKPFFNWSTIENATDLKNRFLPLAENLPPTFAQIREEYLLRKKAAGVTDISPQAEVLVSNRASA